MKQAPLGGQPSWKHAAALAAVLLVVTLGLGAGPAAAHDAITTGPSARAGDDALIGSMTSEVLALASPRQRGPGAQPDTAVIRAAVRRQQALESLLQSDPEAALRHATLAGQRQSFPRAVRPYVEQRVEVEGAVDIVHEDGFGSSRYLYRIAGPNGRWSLHLAGHRPAWLSGERVRVRGLRVGSAIVASMKDVEALGAAVLPQTMGPQRVLVLLVNFAGSTEQPYTVEEARQLFFQDGSAFFAENSYGHTWLEGDVRGWFTLPIPRTCDFEPIQTYAEQAAVAAGIDLASYPRRAFVFPNLGCPFGGLGSIAGNPSRAWIQSFKELYGQPDRWTVAHELGHNLGLYHSHGLDCGDAVLRASGCALIEYGDTRDAMGSRFMHYNAAQKERLGWLGQPGLPGMASVASSGTYFLKPYELGDGLKALRIPRSAGDALYVEYRRPAGADGPPNGPALDEGVLVHLGAGPEQIYLLDTSPVGESWSAPALAPGSSFADSGVTISPLWSGPEGAVVAVDIGHSVAIASGPGGIPNAAPADTGVEVSVVAEDSLGHPLTYQWSASCPALGSGGSFSDPHGARSTWSPPANDSGARQLCVIDVTVADGQGGAAHGSYRRAVLPSGLVPIFHDDMENGPGRWFAGASWALTSATAHSGTRAWTDSPSGNYGNGVSVNLYTPAVSLAGMSDAALSFWHRYDLEDGKDFANVWVCDSANGCVMAASFSGTRTEWTRATVDLSPWAGRASVWVAFDVRSDGAGNRDGWYLDDVVIAGLPVRPPAGPALVASVLPASRSVKVGTAATAFVTVINTGRETANDVGIALASHVPATLHFWSTDPSTNAIRGARDAGVAIGPGAAATFVVAITPWLEFPATDVAFEFSGLDTPPVPALVGVSTLLLSASGSAVADVVALAATASGDGIARAGRAPSGAAFSVATVNVGAADTVTITADTGGVPLPLALSVCPTDPTRGVCTAPPSASSSRAIAAGGTGTYAVFVQVQGPIAFDPARHRIFVVFRDGSGQVRGKTSVALWVEGT